MRIIKTEEKLTESREYYDRRMGSHTVYRHPLFRGFKYTSEVKEFADRFGAWWLVDFVGSYFPKWIKWDDFLIIFVDVDTNKSKAVITVRSDTNAPVLFKKNIDYTDLNTSVKFYLDNDTLMFPSDR